MTLIHYEIKKDKIYRENKLTNKKEAEKELGHYRYLKLLRENKCNLRPAKTPEIKEENKVHINSKQRKEQRLIKENRANYNACKQKYRTSERNELWRKNKRYGYYNFVTYLDDLEEETINKAILEDLKNNKDK